MTKGERLNRIEATPATQIPAVAAELLADLMATSGQPEEWARDALGYLLGYCDRATAEAWYAALPDVAHPVLGPTYGRGYWPTLGELLSAGVAWGRSSAELPWAAEE